MYGCENERRKVQDMVRIILCLTLTAFALDAFAVIE